MNEPLPRFWPLSQAGSQRFGQHREFLISKFSYLPEPQEGMDRPGNDPAGDRIPGRRKPISIGLPLIDEGIEL